MSSNKKSRLEQEKERLEALQNAEKKFLTGMYGDFFGRQKNGKDSSLSFGESAGASGEKTAEESSGKTNPGSGSAGSRTERRTAGSASSLGDRIDALEQKGREVTSQFSSRADALRERQNDLSSGLQGRKDALQRANDALQEVQSLLDNPLYNGMPSLTGRGSANSAAGPKDLYDAGSEINPGLMAGSEGDLFTGFSAGRPQMPGVPGAAQAGAPQMQTQQSTQPTLEAAKPREP